MTIDEIYSSVINHMIKGIMIHEQLADYYDFIGLKGYSQCHEYHFIAESCAMRKLSHYYITHHNKLIPELAVENPTVLPSNWYRYTRLDVDNGTRKNAVKTGLQLWYDWENETKAFYEKMYDELLELGEIAAANIMHESINDVDTELATVTTYWLNKKATEYDLNGIIGEQKSIYCDYKKKLKKLMCIE